MVTFYESNAFMLSSHVCTNRQFWKVSIKVSGLGHPQNFFGVDQSAAGVASDCSVYCDEMLFISSTKNDWLRGIHSHVEFDAELIWQKSTIQGKCGYILPPLTK